MTPGEYILGLLAIISGLAITQMVAGLHFLLFERKRLVWDWQVPLTGVLIAYSLMFSWWNSWAYYHDYAGTWTFVEFLWPIAQLVCLFLAGRAILPSEIDETGKIDLRAHYDRVRSYVWAAFAATYALTGLGMVLQLLFRDAGGSALVWGLPGMALGLALCMTLLFVHKRAVNLVMLPIMLALTIAATANVRL